MSTRQSRGGAVVPIVAVLGLVAVGVVVARYAPVDSTPGRAAHEARRTINNLPHRIRLLVYEAQSRFDQAKEAFRSARIESERALVSQLQEAKERGSVPPL